MGCAPVPGSPTPPGPAAEALQLPFDSMAPATQPFTVEIILSARRIRTVGAQLRGDVLTVTVPGWMKAGDAQEWAEKMAARFRRSQRAERIDLVERAAVLARRHRLPTPTHIRWSDDMTTRWGSCTPATGTVRISTRLAAFPGWVVDSVIVHELCHLEVPGHGAEFWRLAHRYPKMERAIGYLMAKSTDADEDADDPPW